MSETTVKTVWIIESGEHESRSVVCVAVTAEAGFASVMKTYQPPYVVSWRPIEQTRDISDGFNQFSLIGDFEAVQGFSTKHTAQFDATEMELVL